MNSNETGSSGRAILYFVSEDWVFLSHRLPMASAARKAGYDVHVATRANGKEDAIRSEGFSFHPLPFRRGVSPISALATILALRQIERQINPVVIHHSSLQCCVLGAIAAAGTSIRQINAFTGLGYAFTSKTFDARAIRIVITALLRFFLNKRKSIALVENNDDRAALENLGISPARIALILGSGVDTDFYHLLPEPDGPITVGFAGRLLSDKGIRTLVTAHRLLLERGLDVRLLIAGDIDPANPASVSQEEAENWNHEKGITWLGRISDIKTLWARSHIAALPSYREGLPVSLMEAAACGRPMVATDVPGCREIVINDRTGLLVPLEDPAALADAIEKLVKSPELRARYGNAARQFVVDKLSADVVGKAIVELYSSAQD